jgi:NADH dehydrogenase FAD-containing subunit/uncharacterized membrane protein YphA (DoxX/SURF4 family)
MTTTSIGRARDPLVAVHLVVSSARVIGDGLGAWLDLLIRFWLAKAFLLGAAVAMVMGTPPSMTLATPLNRVFDAVIASPIGAVVQILCPILLLLGVASRIAAIPLLIQACLLQGPQGPSPLHLFWAVLLGWILVHGPGAVSLDALVGRGLVSTAIPGARRVGGAFDWVGRRISPVYLLVLRLWAATAPLAGGLAATHWSSAMRHGPIAPWLASIPDATTAIPPGSLLVVALLMAAGLGTRIMALCLVALVPLTQAAMQLDDRLYWALVLGILILRGPGPLALDRVCDWMPTRSGRGDPADDADRPHVVIVGGGFGGLATARGLKGAPCRVTIVDRRNYHLFQPLLYQVATAALSPADIATPIRSLFRLQANVRVMLGEVGGVDAAARHVQVDGVPLAYDVLVLATGAQHSYFGKDDWAASAPGLKSIEHATEIRRRLLTAFERAESAADPVERQAWMTFVIVGGGPTGVELAGAIAELARHGLDKEFRAIDPSTAAVVLVQSGPRVLPTFPEVLSADAATALKLLGVDVRLGAKVEHVDENGIVLVGERLSARTILWAAGVEASPAGDWLGAMKDRAGRVVVSDDLSVAPHQNVFAVGDVAASTAWNGNAVPGLAPAAKQGGAYVASVIRARLADRPTPKPFKYRHAGSLATIGRKAAVADFGLLKVRGSLAWWLWGAAHVLFLVGGRNRTSVLLEWSWAYVTYRRGTRLITDPRAGR